MAEEAAPQLIKEDAIYVELTYFHLDLQTIADKVKSPKAGAIVLFAGTTRDSFDARPVSQLSYTAYTPLAIQTLLKIAREVQIKHSLQSIAMVHRLGPVPIGEESILIAVSAPHRTAAWRAGEEALEQCKERVEVWKLEEFADGEGAWRANRDGKAGLKVE